MCIQEIWKAQQQRESWNNSPWLAGSHLTNLFLLLKKYHLVPEPSSLVRIQNILYAKHHLPIWAESFHEHFWHQWEFAADKPGFRGCNHEGLSEPSELPDWFLSYSSCKARVCACILLVCVWESKGICCTKNLNPKQKEPAGKLSWHYIKSTF